MYFKARHDELYFCEQIIRDSQSEVEMSQMAFSRDAKLCFLPMTSPIIPVTYSGYKQHMLGWMECTELNLKCRCEDRNNLLWIQEIFTVGKYGNVAESDFKTLKKSKNIA